jgi:predicted phosphoribosyltransferase
MRAAVAALRAEGPREIIVAVPVGAGETCAAMTDLADDVVCLATPEPFYAVGLWYEDFEQTEDEEVHGLLERAAARPVPPR